MSGDDRIGLKLNDGDGFVAANAQKKATPITASLYSYCQISKRFRKETFDLFILKKCAAKHNYSIGVKNNCDQSIRSHFALKNASQSPPPTRKLPLIRDISLTRLAESMRPARPAASA